MKIIIYLFIFLSAYWIVRILISFFWIKKLKKNFHSSKQNTARSFILVIPVLNEKDVILATIDYFLVLIKPFPGSKLLIVTTEKENKIYEQKKKSARELINRGIRDEIISLIKSDFAKDLSYLLDIGLLKNKAMEIINGDKNTIDVLNGVHKNDVIIIHYPFTFGKMAHQLNFCLKLLINKGVWTNEILGIYNADSRPEQETLFWLNKKGVGSGLIFQQYGNYFGNIYSIMKEGFFRKATLLSSSIWQNRWSVGFEIFNNLKQFIFPYRNIMGGKFLYPLNYCIGHGLFFTKDIFERQNFSEDTHNEDAIFGLRLSYEEKKILPLPFFDFSDSPNSIRSLFFQKSSWFLGPFQAPLYYKKLKAKITGVNKLKLFLLSGKLFFHAIFWLIGPSCLLLLFLNALINLDFKLFLLCYFCFLVLPGFLTYILFPNKKIKAMEVLFFLVIGSFSAYIIHGASAYYSIFLTIRSIFTKKEIDKYKTKILRN